MSEKILHRFFEGATHVCLTERGGPSWAVIVTKELGAFVKVYEKTFANLEDGLNHFLALKEASRGGEVLG